MSEELCALRDMARKFSREEILPVAAEHDKTGEVEKLLLFFLFHEGQIFVMQCSRNYFTDILLGFILYGYS